MSLDVTHAAPGAGRQGAPILETLRADAALWADFLALCDHGGRLAGTPSEVAALDWAAAKLQSVPGAAAAFRRDVTPYAGWHCHRARLTELRDGRDLEARPLLGTASTPPEGLELEVLDLGRGTPDQIRAAGPALRGRAVMVRHEYPFARETVHRRVKLAAAQEAGAAAFLVAQPEPGIGAVSGSSGRDGKQGIPAMGVSAEAAAILAQPGMRIRMLVDGEDLPDATTETVVLDMPGAGPGRVVLCAHLDGHPMAESAIDNATGVAAVLALARAMAPHVPALPRGLTVCLFSAEEWALQGSREWLRRLPAEKRARIVFNLNLDSIAGAPRLTALTSGFPRLGAFAQAAAAASGYELGVHLPLMSNSDHANFAAWGIPAMRLIAGFDEPQSALRLLLSAADRRELVRRDELTEATLAAGAVLWGAMTAPEAILADLRQSP